MESRLSRCFIPGKSKNERAVVADVKLANEVRPITFKMSLICECSGSAYVELGDVKLICSIHGPRPKMGGLFSDNCQVYILYLVLFFLLLKKYMFIVISPHITTLKRLSANLNMHHGNHQMIVVSIRCQIM